MNLVLRAGGHILGKYCMIVNAVNSLPGLKFLSIDPTVVFQTRFVHLPNASMFHCISHLDLTTQWPWEAVVRGFQYLCCLTHLLITWKQSRYVTDALQDLLCRPDFAMLVLWRDKLATYPLVISSLVRRKLDDPRVAVLRRVSCWYFWVDGGLWLHAAHLIAWCQENNSEYGTACLQAVSHLPFPAVTTVEHPQFLKDTSADPEIDLAMFPWECD